jgi:hypothetical protein
MKFSKFHIFFENQKRLKFLYDKITKEQIQILQINNLKESAIQSCPAIEHYIKELDKRGFFNELINL